LARSLSYSSFLTCVLAPRPLIAPQVILPMKRPDIFTGLRAPPKVRGEGIHHCWAQQSFGRQHFYFYLVASCDCCLLLGFPALFFFCFHLHVLFSFLPPPPFPCVCVCSLFCNSIRVYSCSVRLAPERRSSVKRSLVSRMPPSFRSRPAVSPASGWAKAKKWFAVSSRWHAAFLHR
jgi:hypothetical protein